VGLGTKNRKQKGGSQIKIKKADVSVLPKLKFHWRTPQQASGVFD
jgi:hypothetical protein